ncbi:unnamed protein product [Allacma fusca]|uniref:Translation factor GUF1 homolog, mitochondrial n=1 Tax=Allacma fusca TaxID=39272 RepID=A0A8J2JKC6_9HEXA|nr:unnamed protein product [Allacma fusca]
MFSSSIVASAAKAGVYPCNNWSFRTLVGKRKILMRLRLDPLFCKYSSHEGKINIVTEEFPAERIRNFSIIAHIDHGKSTLADRMLEMTGTIDKTQDNRQILDKLQVERERGITVKAQTATMVYEFEGQQYLLNLIDTPGHVDFSYEVSRSLQACQGVILLVDANQGVQAQTFANFYLAFSKNLPIIPVLNKIDLKNANPERVIEQLSSIFEIDAESVLKVSAKQGTGVNELLQAVIDRIPPPPSDRNLPAKALLFDSWYDKYKGVALLMAVHNGSFKLGQHITLAHANKSFEIKEIGIMYPEPTPLTSLYAGQVGYIYCNMRSVKEAAVGDTIHLLSSPVEPFPGFAKAKPMVFAGVYPMDQSEHTQLRSALEKLLLNDPSVECAVESSPALGNGWRLGFLGVLHMDVFNQRLEQEYGTQVVLTAPSVPFKIKLKNIKSIKKTGDILMVNNPEKMPNVQHIEESFEPLVTGTIITPSVYLGDIIALCLERRGVQIDSRNIDSERLIMIYKLPLNEIVVDFYDKLKSLTSGYASFDYEDAGYESSNLSKLQFLLNGDPVEELSVIVHTSKAREVGKQVCSKLRDTIPRQQYQIQVQACVGGKIVAREDIKALRKDVTQKLKYGGDINRRNKLLKRQAEGKKRMRMVGNIEVPREAFIKVLQR